MTIIINYNNNICKPDTAFTVKYNLCIHSSLSCVSNRFKSGQHASPPHYHAQVF